MKAGDVMDIHSYPKPAAPNAESGRAIVLGEFGGLGLALPGHTWQKEHWGYRGMRDVEELASTYEGFLASVRSLKETAGLCAAVYTQITDVEVECNGLMTYDRMIVKAPSVRISDANRGRGHSSRCSEGDHAAPRYRSGERGCRISGEPPAPRCLLRWSDCRSGASDPQGWLKKMLEIERDGMVGRLAEISPWLDRNTSAWANSAGTGSRGWEELPYWLKGYGDLGYVLGDTVHPEQCTVLDRGHAFFSARGRMVRPA